MIARLGPSIQGPGAEAPSRRPGRLRYFASQATSGLRVTGTGRLSVRLRKGGNQGPAASDCPLAGPSPAGPAVAESKERGLPTRTRTPSRQSPPSPSPPRTLADRTRTQARRSPSPGLRAGPEARPGVPPAWRRAAPLSQPRSDTVTIAEAGSSDGLPRPTAAALAALALASQESCLRGLARLRGRRLTARATGRLPPTRGPKTGASQHLQVAWSQIRNNR